jgi:hypothetical protein
MMRPGRQPRNAPGKQGSHAGRRCLSVWKGAERLVNSRQHLLRIQFIETGAVAFDMPLATLQQTRHAR